VTNTKIYTFRVQPMRCCM